MSYNLQSDNAELRTLEQSLNLNLYSLEQTRRLAGRLPVNSSADSSLKQNILHSLNQAEQILLDLSAVVFDAAEGEADCFLSLPDYHTEIR